MQFLLLGGEYLPSLIVATLSGFLLWATLAAIGQNWVKTMANTVTYLFLPVIGYVVILVISNNVALSLGLVGALSIVRFRHPVKSPLELVMYFALVTVGIAAAARPIMALVLAGVGVLILLTVYYFGRTSKSLAWRVDVSATEPRIIRATCSISDESLLQHPALVYSSSNSDSGESEYRFSVTSSAEAKDLFRELKSNPEVKNLSGSF